MRFEPLTIREGFLEVVKNTFNYRIIDAGRLKRQLEQTSRLVTLLPVQRLSIPRDLDQLPSFRETIIADLHPEQLEVAICAD